MSDNVRFNKVGSIFFKVVIQQTSSNNQKASRMQGIYVYTAVTKHKVSIYAKPKNKESAPSSSYGDHSFTFASFGEF